MHANNTHFVQNAIFPSGKDIFPKSLINSYIRGTLEYLIHYILSLKCEQSLLYVNLPILLSTVKPILLSTVKLKLSYEFSQFIQIQNLDFLSVGPRVYFQVFPNS